MDSYRFARLPSNSAVAATVTLLVCAWFFVAGGAIITESPAERAARAAQHKPAAVAAAVAANAIPAARPAVKRA